MAEEQGLLWKRDRKNEKHLRMIMEATASALLDLRMPPSQGHSEAARYVAEKQRQGRQHLQRSNAFGISASTAHENLLQVFEECHDAGWDGYGARPVEDQTYHVAYRLLEALPLGLPTPSFGAEPDGHLTFEWHYDGRRTLSVSISPDGDLHYAALIGPSKVYGTEPFFGELPKSILALITQVSAV